MGAKKTLSCSRRRSLQKKRALFYLLLYRNLERKDGPNFIFQSTLSRSFSSLYISFPFLSIAKKITPARKTPSDEIQTLVLIEVRETQRSSSEQLFISS